MIKNTRTKLIEKVLNQMDKWIRHVLEKLMNIFIDGNFNTANLSGDTLTNALRYEKKRII